MDRTAFSDRCAVKQGAFRLVDVYIGQAGAIRERPVSDFRNTIRNRNIVQDGTTRERRFSNFRDAIRNRDTGQAGTTSERIISD